MEAWTGGVCANENDRQREAHEARAKRLFGATHSDSSRTDDAAKHEPEHDARGGTEREISLADRPTQERSDGGDCREDGDAQHAVAAEQSLEVQVVDVAAPPRR